MRTVPGVHAVKWGESMNYIVSFVYNDRLFHISLPDKGRIVFPDMAQADNDLRNFDHTVVVSAESGTVYVSDVQQGGEETTCTMRLNYPKVLDEARRIAVCVSEELRCESTALLGESLAG